MRWLFVVGLLFSGAAHAGCNTQNPASVAQYDFAAGITCWTLGTGASSDTGTSGHTVPFLDGTNSWSGANTVPTQAPGNSTGLIASTAFVGAAVTASGYVLPAMTTSTLGGLKGNATLVNRTTSPITVPIAGIVVLGISILPSVSVTVPGVTAGDFVLASFNGAAPTSITLTGVQATANNTVLVTPATTAALSIGSSNLSLNFAWIH